MALVANDEQRRRAGAKRVAWIGFAVAAIIYIGFMVRMAVV